MIVVRYADDFVMGFEHRREADRCLRELQERFESFGLTLHPDKTRLLEFGRYAAGRRRRRGEGKPETFDFLGFTHYCGRSRGGSFQVLRKTVAKRMRGKLREVKAKLRRRMHDAVSMVGDWLRSVVQGWFNYYAIPGNYRRLETFRSRITRLWLRVLRRRSHRGKKWTWARMNRLVALWLPRARILHPYPHARLIV